MKRKTYKQATAKFQQGIIRKLCSMDIDPELALDAVQNMICTVIDKKAYKRISYEAIDGRMRNYLTQAAIYEVGNLVKQRTIEEGRAMSTTDFENEQDTFALLLETAYEPTVDAIEMCPFCHVGVLNQYHACALCGTILGQGKRLKEVLDVEEVTLSDWPDIGLMADVASAMESLSELERKLVNHIIHGNDTLDDMSELTGVSRSVLGRVFVEAKRKLSVALYAYNAAS